MAPAATSAVNSPRLWPVTMAGCGALALRHRRQRGDPRRQHGGLRALGGVQIFGGTLLRQLPEVVAEHLRSLIEGCAHDGRFVGELAEHADRLGALAGKYECERWIRMGAKYSDSVAARAQEERQRRARRSRRTSAHRRSVFDGARKWHRTGELLVGQFHDDERGEDPAVEIAPPQMRQRAGRHHAMQCTRGADVPLDLAD